MNTAENIEKLVKAFFKTKKSSAVMPIEKDKQILDDALSAYEKSKMNISADLQPGVWRIIMKSRITKLVSAAAVVLAATLGILFLKQTAAPAWALSESIEALRNFGGLCMVGTVTIDGQEKGTEIWMQANKSKTSSQDCLTHITNGIIQWVRDGSTYTYIPQENTVYYENAVTAGASPWLGPPLLEMLGKMEGTKIIKSKDPATGGGRATLIGSIQNVNGFNEYVIEFDTETKLPVAMKMWDHPDRSGPPTFEASKITYYEELSKDLFDVKLPGNPKYVEKPLTIPNENIGLLSSPDDGISAEGLSQQQACEKIVKQIYEADIAGDVKQFKKLCPLARNWYDEDLRSFILRKGQGEQVVELIKIGQICKMGSSKLGPLAAVPVIFKHKDGIKAEDKMIVQFRQVGGKSSCVVYGPYGFTQEIE
ncbi:MAG: hypothetical protein ABSE89_05130 [Sedimentisphaerales bacterium]